MCTVTWQYGEDGAYQVFFNRDERHSRKQAYPPTVHTVDGLQCLAPIDADANGTWIAVTERGVTACVLNLSGANLSLSPTSTRGSIPFALLSGEALDPACHQPFTVLLLDPHDSPRAWQWTGSETVHLDIPRTKGMLTSSSLDQQQAQQHREGIFLRKEGRAFHTSHAPYPGPWSVCMHRPDAQTVSFTHVRVTPKEVKMNYHPAAPCQPANVSNLSIHAR